MDKLPENLTIQRLNNILDPQEELKCESKENNDAVYTLVCTGRQNVKMFKMMATTYKLHIKETDDPIGTFEEALDGAIAEAFDGYPNAKIGVEINHTDLQTPVNVPFSSKEKLTSQNVINLLEAVQQSKKTMDLGTAMAVKIVRIDIPRAKGRIPGIRLYGREAPCIVKIKNTDDLCVLRAVCYEIARQTQKDSSEAQRHWRNVRNGDKQRYTGQKRAALALARKAGLSETGGCGLDDIKKIQAVVTDFQLKVWKQGLQLIYCGPPAPKQIHLLWTEGHCDVIKSISRFFGQNYFCETCNKAFAAKKKHTCSAICKHCRREGECELVQWRKCPVCKLRFPNEQCFNNHKTLQGKEKKTTCEQVMKCTKCDKIIWHSDKHRCGQRQCPSCRQYDFPEGHAFRCYIQPLEESSKEPKGFIFFDFETRQTKQLEDGCFEHVANFAVAQKTCDSCKDNWAPDDNCIQCGQRQLVFKGDKTVQDLCKWILQPAHKGYVVLSHYGGKFDNVLVLQYIINIGLKPKIIQKGRGVVSIELYGIRFLDSWAFWTMPLAKLPKAAGFEGVKGHFPHDFNREEFWNYRGQWPALEYYCPDEKSKEERKELTEWHAQQEGKTFDFQEEIEKYCVADVTILRKAAMHFRKLLKDIGGGIDVYTDSCTLAGACNRIFRTLFLGETKIGIVPHLGYRPRDKQSVTALQWLKWIEHSQGVKIQHAGNAGEVQLAGLKLDGYCHETKTAYEFHGCIWHGCTCIKKRDKTVPGSHLTMEEAYNRTMDRRDRILENAEKLEEIWECSYKKQLAINPEMAAFVDELEIVTPLEPREAFYGGRTNAFKLLHDAEKGEEIRYLDIVSLYPTVCKMCPYPLDHPEVIIDNFEQVTAENMPYYGIVKADVLPPQNLWLPVLPMRTHDGRLCFPLCRTCANEQAQKCTHEEPERTLRGAWVTEELKCALQRGYRVTKLHEVWHYNSKSDPTDTQAFFGAYVNNFLRIKAQASGFPSGVVTEEEKEAFVADFLEKEGIQLDMAAIEKNPGLRQLAKLCLNSFWGKFGQRNNLQRTEFFDNYNALAEVLDDPAVNMAKAEIAHERLIGATYVKYDAFVDSLPNTSPTLAAFVTCHARLRLLEAMELLGKRLLYCDTDSVIYTYKDGDAEPQRGQTLGTFTDEIADEYGEGAYCRSFVSGGPKNYGMEIVRPDGTLKQTCKAKGLTLNYKASGYLNYTSMRRKVLEHLNSTPSSDILVPCRQIVQGEGRIVKTKHLYKAYNVVYTKRKLLASGDTLPWGYL